MKEEWRDSVEFKNLYRVSNLGRVLSVRRGKAIIRKQRTNRQGYKIITTTIAKGKTVSRYVHRLVAEAFIPNPNNLPCIIHKDENPSNNRVDNLEWCTHKYKNNYGTRNQKLSKSKRKKVFLTLNGINGGRLYMAFPSMSEASNYTGICACSISACCIKRQKTAHNLIWRYLDEK